MRDAFGTVIAIIVTIIGLFIVPMQYFADKQDMITQAYVYACVSDFVSDVQLTGYISQDQYNEFQKELSNTNVRYDVEMTHSHEVVSPEFNETGDAVKGTKTITSTKYEDEILEDVFDTKGIHTFDIGDKFSVTVKNSNRTLGQKLAALLTGSSTKYSIVATYGATIRNANY